MIERPNAHAWDDLRGRQLPPAWINPPRDCRCGPFGTLVPDWPEYLTFDFSVAAGAQEGASSRDIYGALLIEEIAIRSDLATTDLLRVSLFAGDDSPAPQTVAAGDQSPLAPAISDNAAVQVGGWFLSTEILYSRIGRLIYGPKTRLSLVLNNTTGATHPCIANLRVTHMLDPKPYA